MRLIGLIGMTSVVACGLLCAGAKAAPTLGPWRVLTPQVGRYERFEVAGDIKGDWQNPFDPDQADVNAAFTTPSGQVLRVPAFWYQDYAEEPVTSQPRQHLDLLKLFLNEKDWIPGTKIEFFVDDVALLDEAEHEIPFDDMEQGDGPRASAGGGTPPLTFSTEVVHGGKRAVRFAPEPARGTERWPSMAYALGGADWTRYRGLVLWVYPRAQSALGPVQLYTRDREWGNSGIMRWAPGDGTLVANRWNRLVWHWGAQPPPIRLTPRGAPEWRVRFTPTQIGRYSMRLSARDHTGETLSEATSFTVGPSTNPGFVRVSREDPHYFVFDNGTPFFPIGHDVPWGLGDVRAYFPKMKAHGENATYFILTPWDMSFEWDKLGEYNLERAARLDRVVDCARDNGIYLKLSFDCHDNWRPSSQWGKSPYNAANGGPCASPNDLYTSPAAWAYYAKRTRYLAARWGYSPNMMAWEPVAELDGATQLGGSEGWGYMHKPGGEAVSAMVAPFLQKLAAHLKSVDPYGRLFTTSFGSDNSDDNHWRLPEIQYTQIHCYDLADPSDTLSRWARELTTKYAKPMLVTEFGWGTRGVPPGVDPEGINLHNGLWASALSGAAGGALDWWWDRIESANLYRHYPPLRAFVRGIDWPHEHFRPAVATVSAPVNGRLTDVATLLTGQGGFGDVTQEEYAVTAEGKLAGEIRPPTFLLARGRSEHRIAPRFVLNFPRPAAFAVEVAKVSPDARLEIRLDGVAVRMVDLPAQDVPGKLSTYDEKWKVWACQYDEAYAITVPAGRHEIQVENVHPGASWIQVNGYRIIRREPVSLRVLGLTGRTTALLWVQNRESLWYNWQRSTPEPVTGGKLTLSGLPAGPLRYEWLDTWTGEILKSGLVQPRAGATTLVVPAVSRDVACRLQR